MQNSSQPNYFISFTITYVLEVICVCVVEVLDKASQFCVVLSYWQVEIDHDGNIYTTEIKKKHAHKLRLDLLFIDGEKNF